MARKQRQKRWRVLVRLHMRYKAGRMISVGVLRYAATHPHIEVHVVGGGRRDEICELGAWVPDGIVSDTYTALSKRSASVRAAVLFHSSGPIAEQNGRQCVRMRSDNAAAGRMAAAHFLRHNIRHFGYVGALFDFDWSLARGAAFAEEVGKAGFAPPSVFRTDKSFDLAQEKEALLRWLRALPKPCGIFAANDWRAMTVLNACREAGIDVPEVAQVIGVDNEEYICEQTVPTLTSIEPDFEGGGYEAMRMLDAMLSGRRVADRTLTYGMRGIVERLSALDFKGTARIVNLALDFIRLHGASGATAADVVKAAGCSSSLLERYFRKTVGRTVVQELQRVRLEKACYLLRHSETPIGEIGPLCGYGDETYFKIIFRRAYGKSMRDYRRDARKGNG